MAFGSLFLILIFCSLGTIVEIGNDTITNAISNINWNLMEKREQHMYRLLMYGSQNAYLITIGGLTPLNVATSLKVSVHQIDGQLMPLPNEIFFSIFIPNHFY